MALPRSLAPPLPTETPARMVADNAPGPHAGRGHPAVGIVRLGVLLAVFAAGYAHPDIRPLLLGALTDAWLQVGVFVAATFVVVFLFERRASVDGVGLLVRHPRYEVPIAAALGALPGCGGAVVVVTRYAAGQTSFGALVAVLTSTMGDAAFLVLARRPDVGLLLIGLGFVVGTVFGYLVDAIHGRDFLRGKGGDPSHEAPPPAPVPPVLWWLWGLILVPSLVVGALGLFEVAVPDGLALALGLAGALLSLALWALSPSQAATLARDTLRLPLVERVARNTNYVTIWVVVGFLAYELATGLGGLDVKSAFSTVQGLLPLMGVLVGFLPGCGPQIVVSTLYLSGAIPFSAQLANAISNDGDALFPAIAAAPRAALIATVYTAIPALIMGYGCYLLLE
ncbi:MAG: arsenic efflux protein [Planctomycetes bacterium]|nr:arsenic efflux protein [Planctomycetota bacterium]